MAENTAYTIRISSQKGGVGKTTIAVNLAVALAMASYRTLLVDADTTNPSVGFHLGLDEVNIGYDDVIRDPKNFGKAVVLHAPSGLYVLPGTIHGLQSTRPPNVEELMNAINSSKYDFVIVDTSPGLSTLEPAAYLNEAMIITTPEMSSCTSSIRLAKLLDKSGIRHNLLVNRVRNRKYEISMLEIEELYGNKIIGSIPEDDSVAVSVADHIPAYTFDKKSQFSAAIKSLSRMYAAKGGKVFGSEKQSSGFIERGGLIGLIKRILGLR